MHTCTHARAQEAGLALELATLVAEKIKLTQRVAAAHDARSK
jgi:hypothetical protein